MNRNLATLLFLAVISGPVALRADDKPPRFEWQTAAPERHGMSSARLEALRDELQKRQTHSFLVIRNDRIVYEWYAPEYGRDKRHGTASLAKALVGGLALGVALSDGRISLDDRASKFIPSWKDDPRKGRITIRQLGSHTSGLDDAEESGMPHEKLTGWKGDFWKRNRVPNDPFTLARDRTPARFEPGKQLHYSNPGIGLLTYCTTAAIQDSPDKDVRTLLRNRVMRPIGAADGEWSVGYGQTFTVDGLPLVASWGGGSYTPRSVARIGRLVLREGDWEGKRLLTREAIHQVVNSAGLPGACGMGWWTNASGRYPWLPRDAVWGAGAGDQVLLVVPSLKLIMVRNGNALAAPPKPKPGEAPPDVFEAYHDPRARILFEPLIAAIADSKPKKYEPPYPPSPVIRSIEWAARSTIVRRAKGSDNWPLTWADDGHLYTAYGDGNGFEPFVKSKLSLGLARIEGDASAFQGTNLRSKSLEQQGDGARGKKASGILMVDGVLYLWTRNAGNAQLAWSADRGATWKWADWKFTASFGCPTFLNFGRNYAGARDGFVYVYSHDADSAYTPADRMVLARVPQGRIRDREAYEFFQGRDERGQPRWTKAIAERRAVFEHKNRCGRSAITYNAGLKRYLWVQTTPGTQGDKMDSRFAGGFGIYDAPEPWGPWTTAYFTNQWDVGPGESASFPSKWMSADGRTLHLVFSGDDCFSVRAARIALAAPPSR